jgi:hypothetical protein
MEFELDFTVHRGKKYFPAQQFCGRTGPKKQMGLGIFFNPETNPRSSKVL